MPKSNAASRVMFQRNGWPDPPSPFRDLVSRYAPALLMGAIMGVPAAAWVVFNHFCK